MNSLQTLLAAAAVAALAGGLTAVTVSAGNGATRAEPDTLPVERDSAALDGARLTELEDAVRALTAKVEGLELAPAATPVSTRVPADAIQAAVDRWLAENGPIALDPTAAATSPNGAEQHAYADYSTDELVELLLADDLDGMEREALWRELAGEGRLDELIAAFEARVEADPSNPETHVDVASAYLQKIQEVGPGPMAGLWATKADGAYDQALELDPQHWEARFSKAASLSFWPPIFGKQGEAIQQFEILLDQQSAGAPEPHHAETYLFLGNLYQQSGQLEKAAATWKQGLALFPDHGELSSKGSQVGD